MSGHFRIIVYLLAGCCLALAATCELKAQSLTGEHSAADQSPRYLPQDSSAVRPLEASTAEPAASDFGASPQRPSRPATRSQLAERLASGGDDVQAPRQITAAAAEGRAVPLSPPNAGGREARQHGEMSALATGAASLGIVIGLFLVVVWAVRRGMPKGAGLLPREALEVLGRAPLVGKQQVHLVRCGNKLLLVCVCGLTVQTLTEITDAVEVERLSELCQSHAVAGNAGFSQVLKQFSASSRHGGYYGGHDDPPDFGSLDTDLSHVPRSLA